MQAARMLAHAPLCFTGLACMHASHAYPMQGRLSTLRIARTACMHCIPRIMHALTALAGRRCRHLFLAGVIGNVTSLAGARARRQLCTVSVSRNTASPAMQARPADCTHARMQRSRQYQMYALHHA